MAGAARERVRRRRRRERERERERERKGTRMAEGQRDLLYALRNNFHLGAYQAAIAEAQDLQHDDLGGAETVERDIFMYRAYIELGQTENVLAEITNESPLALQACRLLALIRTDGGKKDEVVAQITEWLSDPAYSSNLLLCELCGEIFMAAEMYEEALSCCSSAGSLELLSLAIQVALQIERPDVAKKLLDLMQQKDDDAPLTQLATAWVNVQIGGERLQEVSYIFQELGDRFNWTPKLLNGAAVCNMVMGKFEEAEKQSLEALSKDPKQPDALANLVSVCLHLNKPASKYLTQLKAADPNHPLSKKLGSLEEKFVHAAAAAAAD